MYTLPVKRSLVVGPIMLWSLMAVAPAWGQDAPDDPVPAAPSDPPAKVPVTPKPVAPEKPTAPGPVAPEKPVAPVTPAAPVTPGAPVTPAAPVAPTAPSSSGPAAPTAPPFAVTPDGDTIIRPGETPNPQKPPTLGADAGLVDIEFVDAKISDMLVYFANMTQRSFILGDIRELEGKKVTIISHKRVTVGAAWEAFVSALEVSGFTTVDVGQYTKVIKLGKASESPLTPLGSGDRVPRTDRYVTQLFTLENISANDISQVVQNLKTPDAKVISYAPTNSLIITESGNNLVKIHRIISELDIAAPKSALEILPIVYAKAEDVKKLIEELYGTAEVEEKTTKPTRSSRRPRRDEKTTTSTEALTAGESSKYISKVMADDRTNSLIVLANDEGHAAIRDLLGKLDVDVDLASQSKIHVVRLEHSKAKEMAAILQQLSQQQGQSTSRGGKDSQSQQQSRSALQRLQDARSGNEAAATGEDGESTGALAAFDSGMRIAADPNTNSLVIIASENDFEIVGQVIEDLDVLRKQVYVDAVILELSSIDGLDLSTAYHAPFSPSGESVGFMGGQFGTSSLGLTDDLLSGLAFGVFGQTIDVPLADGTVLPVPTFGVALTALKTNQMVNIVSNPSLLTLDNEKAKIVVGRKIPFPTTSGLNNLGQPVVSFQREDVAITLELVPRVNSENFVTLEVDIEVQEIEESADSDAISQGGGGFITSKRQVKTHALVKDNQTVVLGGLVGTTESEGESKVPILGDLPLIGALFRNRSESSRKVNLMVFLTPHIIDDENDMLEIMRVKEAQRQEFFRRFYGKNQSEQVDEMRRLLQYSMNYVDQPSVFRGSTAVSSELTLDGMEISDETREVLQQQLDLTEPIEPGSGAGQLPSSDLTIDDGSFIIEDAPEAELPTESEGETPAAGELVDETLDTPSEGEE